MIVVAADSYPPHRLLITTRRQPDPVHVLVDVGPLCVGQVPVVLGGADRQVVDPPGLCGALGRASPARPSPNR